MNGLARASAALCFSFFIGACSLPARGCARPDVFCAGLVSNTAGLQDHGLTESAWRGLEQARQDGLIQQADAIASLDVRDYAKNIEAFAEAGYDVVITSGSGLSEETLQAAELYPGIIFVGLDQEPAAELVSNLTAVTFPRDQGGFLAGALAAQMTRTGVIGASCETSGIPSMWRLCEGFRAGARHIDPDVKVFVEYREGESSEELFLDETWGRESAQAMIREGADVIFGVGGRTGEGALSAAAQAGIWCIGSEQDQFYIRREARSYLLTSIILDAGDAIHQFIGSIRKGAATPGVRGEMVLADYHEGGRFVPLSLQSALMDLKLDLENGSMPTNVSPEAPE